MRGVTEESTGRIYKFKEDQTDTHYTHKCIRGWSGHYPTTCKLPKMGFKPITFQLSIKHPKNNYTAHLKAF